MNIDDLRKKVADVVLLLEVAGEEARELETKRKAIEGISYTNTERERKLQEREISLTQREKEVESQRRFIEEQNKNGQMVLNKITLEKQSLARLREQEEEIKTEHAKLEEERKSQAVTNAMADKFLQEKQDFEKERQLFSKEKLAMLESQKLLSLREQNIKAKEDKLDRIERMTAL